MNGEIEKLRAENERLKRELSKAKTAAEAADVQARENSRILEEILGNLPVVVSKIDKNRVFTKSVGAGLKRLKLKDDQLIGAQLKDILPEVMPHLDKVDEGERVRYEYTGEIDGDEWTFDNFVFPTDDGAVSFAIDITERKKIEDALHEREEFIANLTNNLPSIVYLFDLITQKNLYINEGFADHLGIPYEQARKLNMFEMIHPEDAPRLVDHFEKFDRIEHGKHNYVEYRVKTVEGEWLWFRSYDEPYEKDVDGRTIKILGVAVNVTKEKLLEASLRDEKLRLAVTLNSIGDGVISTDSEGRVVEMNAAARRLTGWTLEEAQGKPLEKTFRIYNSLTGEKAENPVEKALKYDKAVGLANHTKLISKNGEEFQIADSAAPIKTDDGKTLGVVLAFRDESEKYAREQALADSARRLEHAVKASGAGVYEHNVPFDENTILDDGLIKALGYDKSEVPKGEKAIEWYASRLHPGDVDKFRDRTAAFFSGETEQFNEEFRYISKSGELKHFKVNAIAVLRSSDGAVKKAVGLVLDVTGHKSLVEELRRNVTKYQTLLDNLPAGVSITDNKGALLEANKLSEIYLGLNEYCYVNGLLFNPDYEIIREDGSTLPKNEYPSRVALKLGKIVENVYMGVKRGDKVRWLSVTAAPIPHADFGAAITYNDITETIEFEKELEKSFSAVESLVNNIPFIAWIVDADGRFTAVNEPFARSAKMRKSEIVGKTPEEVFPPQKGKIFAENDAKVVKERKPHHWEGVIAEEGKIKWHETIVNPIIDKNGVCVGASGLTRDITERKSAEEDLRKAEKRFRSFLETVDDMVYFQSADGELSQLNNANAKITGYSIEEFERDPKLWQKIIHPDDAKIAEEFFRKNPEGVDRHTAEYRIKTKSGDWKWAQSKMIGVRDSDGAIIGYNCIDRDVTQIKQRELEITELNKELEERVKIRTAQLEEALKKERELGIMKSRFISMISHEYRTPLTVILSSSHIIKQKLGDAALANEKHFDRIQNSVKIMTTLLENVTALGKTKEGESALYPVEKNAAEFLSDLIEELKIIDEKKHIFIDDFSDEKIDFSTDYALLRHIAFNLLTNAVKYSPPNSKIHIKLTRKGDRLKFSVADEGYGVPEKDKEFIFEPFYRNEKHIGLVPGTGLGLAIVKGSVESLGGEISLESSPGEGCVFTVDLPEMKKAN